MNAVALCQIIFLPQYNQQHLFRTQDELLQLQYEYKAKLLFGFGDCSVSAEFKNNTALARWAAQKRAEYKKYCKGDGQRRLLFL